MENKDLRIIAKEAHVPLWKIAELMGISEFTLSRKLRFELPEETAFLFKSIVYYIRDEEKKGKTFVQIKSEF